MQENNRYPDKNSRRKPTLDMSAMVYGKVPPQARDLEDAILGAIMLEKGAFDIAAKVLKPECFYVEGHQRIFKAMAVLETARQPIDILTVSEQLKRTEELDAVGGYYYVTKLTNSVVSSAHIEAHCKIVLGKFMQREVIRIGGEMINSAYEDACEVDEMVSSAEKSLLEVSSNHLKNDMTGISAALTGAVQQIEEWRGQDSTITGVPSGFPAIDHATRGWQPSDLIIVAARPSVGKTAFCLQLVRNATSQKKRVAVAVWSLEMETIQLVLRMLAAESRTMLFRLQTGRMDDAQMQHLHQNGIQQLASKDIFFDDTGGLTMFSLRSKARRLKSKCPHLGLIVIDYLQLMLSDNSKGSREQEVSAISRGLKSLAKELKVPIVALSQLNRAVENRTGAKREPNLSDLRESGAIEQDADVVLFLWGPDEEEVKQDASLANLVYSKIAKQRNGMLVRAELNFERDIQHISQAENRVPGLPSGYKPLTSNNEPNPF